MLPTLTQSDLSRSGAAPRVLTVLPDFPFPATTGLHLRHVSNLELVHRLSCYSAVLYFSTEDRQPPPVESTPLAQIADEVRHGGRRFPHANFSNTALALHKVDFLVRGALSVAGKRYPFSMSYDRIDAEKIILAEAQRVRADFVVLPSFMLHYARALKGNGFGVIADAIDVLSDLTAQFQESYSTHLLSRIGLYANHVASRAQEHIFLSECCEVWATSEPEAEALTRLAPKVKVVVVANSLDECVFAPTSFQAEQSVGFIGTFSSQPNLDAALFLAEQVFPEVLCKSPKARLKLAGANMPSGTKEALTKLSYVDLLGAVADSIQLFRQCRVIALPVSVRGGVPLKLVEALAREKAVVACPELVEGLAVRDGYDLLVRSHAEFATAITLLLGDDGLCRRLGSKGRNTFMANWSRSHAEEVLRRSSVLTPDLAKEIRD